MGISNGFISLLSSHWRDFQLFSKIFANLENCLDFKTDHIVPFFVKFHANYG